MVRDSVIFPAWMTWMTEHNVDKIAQYAIRVWGVADLADKKAVALEGISRLKTFFTSIGLPVTFKELGIENPDIVYGVDCLEGTRSVGHKVLVVGGGMVGAETADFLAEQGHEVAIIEMRDAIGPDVIHEHRIFLMEAFEKYGIKQITSAAVSEIFSDGVSYKNAADKSDETIYEARGFDTVVLSMGFSSRYTHRDGQNVVYDFAEELKDIVPEVHMVGDAVRARRALDATKEAYEVALNL